MAANSEQGAANHALAMVCDALEQITLDRELIESAERAEGWQQAVDNLYLALFNLYAVRAALEEGVAVDAAALHGEVLRHLGGSASTPHLHALISGALRDTPPLGKLALLAGLLREVTEAQMALPSHPSHCEKLRRINARLQQLGAAVVAVAEPLIAAGMPR